MTSPIPGTAERGRQNRKTDAARRIRRAASFAAVAAAALAAPLLVATPSLADGVERMIVIKDHKFQPDTVEIPANVAVRLIVHNQDAAPEEFESKDLNREKIVPPGGKVTIRLDPLAKGKYKFVGEFHEDSAQGTLVVK